MARNNYNDMEESRNCRNNNQNNNQNNSQNNNQNNSQNSNQNNNRNSSQNNNQRLDVASKKPPHSQSWDGFLHFTYTDNNNKDR